MKAINPAERYRPTGMSLSLSFLALLAFVLNPAATCAASGPKVIGLPAISVWTGDFDQMMRAAQFGFWCRYYVVCSARSKTKQQDAEELGETLGGRWSSPPRRNGDAVKACDCLEGNLVLSMCGERRTKVFAKSPAMFGVAARKSGLDSLALGAPQGSVVVVRNSVAIVPDVAGEVIDVPVAANVPLKAGDILFRLDPTPYDAQVKAIDAQLKLSATRLAQMTQLFERDSGRGFDVEQHQSEVDQLKAQLEGAHWNLDKTTIRAPADGYVTNLALRKGARVANLPLSPVMAFIDTSNTLIGMELAQIDARYVAPGQAVEVTFKYLPGGVFTGKVETVLQAIATGKVQTSGLAVQSKGIEAAPFVACIRLDDAAIADSLPAGSTGTAAIFTDHVRAAHVIRRVLLRQIAITNYVNPF